MKLNKKIILSLAALGLTAAVFADDWGFGDEEEAAPEPTVTVGGMVEMNARAYIEASTATYNSNTKKIEYTDRPDADELKMAVFPKGKLNFNYSGISSDVSLSLKFDKTSLYDGYYMDILDEFTARAYVGNAQLEAGKMRVVWGKGDKLHVLDNFNANDYTDYIIPDYIDRRISEPMFRAVYSTNSNVKFEAVYTPVMTADRLASSGVWQPKASKSLTSAVTTLVQNKIVSALSASTPDYSTALKYMQFKSDSLYPDTYQLKYGQAGLRTTFTLGAVDLGLSYYYGHNKQPSANLKNIIDANVKANMAASSTYSGYAQYITVANDGIPTLSYDRVQVFGFEAAGILFGRLNSRAEFAYNLTDDIAGDDPWVHNNSLAWVGGFDIDLPVHNINVNIQENGKYILNYDKIDDLSLSYLNGMYKQNIKNYDVDYTGADTAWNNKLVLDLTDTWNHEKVKLDVKGIWGIERGDVLVMPSLTFVVKDDFNLNLSGLYIWCNNSDSEFDGWERNSFAQIGVNYKF